MSANISRFPVVIPPAIGLVSVLLTSLSCVAAPDVASLLRAAVESQGREQYDAIDDLGELRADAARVVPSLVKLLKDKDGQVQWRSARALGDYGELAQEASASLRALLQAKDSTVRFHAAVALGRIGDSSEATIRALVDQVTSTDAHVARAAISALRNIQPDPKHVIDALEAALGSSDEAVILHAVEAVVERGAAAVPLLNEALKRPKTAYLACVAIHEIGPDAEDTVPGLAALLSKTSHSKLLIEGLLALASIGPAAQSAATEIIPLLEPKEDITVPAAAAYALGSIGATDAENALRRALAVDEPFIQMFAAWSLAKLNPSDEALLSDAIDRLIGGLRSEDATVRTAAAHGLEKLEAPPELVAPALVAMANDPDPAVTANAVDALASLGESVVPHASRALKNPELNHLAVRVLTELGPTASGAVRPLVDALAEADAKLREEIYMALAAIGPAAAMATDALVEGLSSESDGVQHSALYALRKIGPGASVARQTLLAMLESGDDADEIAAAWALARIAPDDQRIGALVVAAAERGLNHDDGLFREAAAETLGDLGPAAARSTAKLMQVAETDSSPLVREAAKNALQRIEPQ